MLFCKEAVISFSQKIYTPMSVTFYRLSQSDSTVQQDVLYFSHHLIMPSGNSKQKLVRQGK